MADHNDDIVEAWMTGDLEREDEPFTDAEFEQEIVTALQAGEDDLDLSGFTDVVNEVFASTPDVMARGTVGEILYHLQHLAQPVVFDGKRAMRKMTPEMTRRTARVQYLAAVAVISHHHEDLERATDVEDQAEILHNLDMARAQWVSAHELLQTLTGVH